MIYRHHVEVMLVLNWLIYYKKLRVVVRLLEFT